MTAGASWKGAERYEIIGRLGDGGMGVVYEAFDRRRRERVALKALRNCEADSLYRFKQEFRALVDVLHPNLVHLHELVADDKDDVFFTMELVEGSDFLDYVHGAPPPPVAAESQVLSIAPKLRENLPGAFPGSRLRLPSGDRVQERPSPDFDRLRLAMVQLVEGVAALHAAGKLHRDLKPSNVRVTREGRVVILDFGVATELRRASLDEEAMDREIVGTAAYMAPEQALGQAPAPASDWYSVGAILYEAIVGGPLHMGMPLQVLAMKVEQEPTAPSARVKGVPEDLDSLCLDLLSVDPSKRPTAEQILRRLGSASSDQAAEPPPVEPTAHGLVGPGLMGRETHIAELRDALKATRKGHAVWTRVSGASGMGKSAVVHKFLEELEKRRDVLVLRGRAYECESVPYKAFDSVVDALSRHLMEVEERGQPLPLPADMEAVAHVFPVLRRVASIEKLAQSKPDDPRTLRQRAFAALRELFDSLARRGPVVVFVDDVHWGDIDSATLLAELVRPPSEPPMLVLTTHLTEEADASPFLVEVNARWPADVEVRQVEVGPLAPEDARRLALALLDSDGPQARRAAESIARESGGSPFLIEELARSASGYRRAALPDQSSLSSSVTLEQMIAERASRLPDDAQRLLQVIAVAGRPLPVATLREAANVADSTPRLVALLRTRRFVRAGLRGGIETIETSHNRIRETIVARLPAEDARRHHARVALALESAPDSDPEAIATHLLGAGDRERASRYAERAAEQAVAKLAFAQAGRLFQLAIDTSATASAAEQQSLRLRLAKAWEWAGQAEKAALAYLAAAKHAAAGDRIELERAAAAQLIAAGRIDEGVAAFHRLLGALDIAVPRSRFWILFLTTFYRIAAAAAVALFWRIRRRDKGDSSAPDHRRLGTLHAMARALAVLDPVSANYLKARYLFEALRSGSLSHKIRSAILEAGSLGAIGKGKSRKERSLFATARRLAEQSGDEEGLGLYDLTYGISEYLRGRWRSAVELLGRAQARLSAVRAWQANAGVYRVFALVSLGELLEVKARTNALLADAERRGDRFTFASLLASHATAAWLASDDAQAARRQLKSAIAGWSKTSFLVQHWQCALWEAETHLYLGEGEQAWQRLARDERRLATSAFARIQLIRSLTLFIRGRSAVASLKSLDGRARRTRLSEARRALGRLKAEAMPYTDALAAMLGASVAKATNDSATAEHELRQAILYAERAEMAVHAAAARYQLGLLLGGRSGSAMLTETETTMRARGVRVPARYAQMLVPGDWPADSAAQPGR